MYSFIDNWRQISKLVRIIVGLFYKCNKALPILLNSTNNISLFVNIKRENKFLDTPQGKII